MFRDPDAPALRYAPIEQFWPEQLQRGLYDAGRLIVIAPGLNAECQTAITRYRAELIADDPSQTRFQAINSEDVTTALGSAGADTHQSDRALSRVRARAPRPGRDLPGAIDRGLTAATTTPPNRPTRTWHQAMGKGGRGVTLLPK